LHDLPRAQDAQRLLFAEQQKRLGDALGLAGATAAVANLPTGAFGEKRRKDRWERRGDLVRR
jgi:hypothetical protein